MKNIIKKNTKGFTLVEVIVAAAIVAIVSVMLVSGFLTVANINMRAIDAKNQARDIDFDIYAKESGATDSKPIQLVLIQNGGPVTTVDGKTITIPLNIKTFSSADTQIMVFR